MINFFQNGASKLTRWVLLSLELLKPPFAAISEVKKCRQNLILHPQGAVFDFSLFVSRWGIRDEQNSFFLNLASKYSYMSSVWPIADEERISELNPLNRRNILKWKKMTKKIFYFDEKFYFNHLLKFWWYHFTRSYLRFRSTAIWAEHLASSQRKKFLISWKNFVIRDVESFISRHPVCGRNICNACIKLWENVVGCLWCTCFGALSIPCLFFALRCRPY